MPKKTKSIQRVEEKSNFLKFGGYPILDFVNTKVIHSDWTEDRLNHPEKVNLFFKEVFQIQCRCSSDEMKKTLEHRLMVRDFFESILRHENLEPDMTDMNKFLSSLRFTPKLSKHNKNELKINWSPHDKISVQASTIVFQFLNFISQADLTRLKKCANTNCSHLFYDVSRNNTRNWCSMKSCGNIMKARAFYKRSKKKLIKE